MESTVLIIALLVLAYASLSAWFERTVLTPPLLFTAAGLALGAGGLDIVALEVEGEAVSLIAEVTLVLLLFVDAARIDLPRLRRDAALPARMLLVALPITIVAGTVMADLLVPRLGLGAAAVLAAILAPTDAALGQAVVSDERVPLRIRQTLNVESGLNDGIVLPVVAILIGFVGAAEGVESISSGVAFVAEQVGFGVLAGVVVGCAGAWLIDRSARLGLASSGFQQVGTFACAIAAFAAAEAPGGNGFIAAFVGGAAFGSLARERCQAVYEFAEEEGHLLTLLVFFVFGAAVVPERLVALDVGGAVFVLLSLTLIRVAPVVVSLLGTGLRVDSMLFLGWFGPRGLATILFGLLVVEEAGLDEGERLFGIALWVVLASIVAHGLSALPLASVYGRRLESSMDAMPEEQHDDMPEMAPAVEFPLRR